MKSEIKRKDDLLNDTKRKIASLEQTLKNYSFSLDNQIKARNEMSTYNFQTEVANNNYMPTGPGSAQQFQ